MHTLFAATRRHHVAFMQRPSFRHDAAAADASPLMRAPEVSRRCQMRHTIARTAMRGSVISPPLPLPIFHALAPFR